jgi:phosphatidylethanolamine-binding protein (PEBP) family uncharacterized protein
MRRRKFISLLGTIAMVSLFVAHAQEKKFGQLRSTGFIDGSTIPQRFNCDGEDLSPPLAR